MRCQLKTWQLQEAKTHLSEVLRAAIQRRPQEITLRGKTAAILISKEDYDKLVKPKPSFLQFMRQSPLVGVRLNLKRNPSKTREIDL
jgi:antitoxin Phd